MDFKKCFKCKKKKPLSDFYKHPQMTDGHLNKCKKCTKTDNNKHREDNLEKVKAYDRKRSSLPHRVDARNKYAQTSAGIEAGNKAKKKWTKKNPDRRAAHTILGNAIKSGKIKRQPCEKCDSTVRVHGHHDDYSMPLEVRWLCPQCHRALHKKYKKETTL